MAVSMVACASDPEETGAAAPEGGGATVTTSGAPAEDGAPASGDPIRVGIVMIDYEVIAQFVDFHRGDQQATAQVLVDWINEEGGIGGRPIEPVFRTYSPIPGQEPTALTTCTALTEDEQVFAVLGVFIDFSGDAQLCLARDHDTVLIGHELEQPWIDASPPGLMLTPDNVLEDDARYLIELLGEAGTLEGRTIAVLGDSRGQARIDDIIVPGLEALDGVELGTTGVLTLGSTDTTAAQAQLDGLMARWDDEGIDTFFIDGLTASAVQWVDQLKARYPEALIAVDASGVVEQARDATTAGRDPNPYDGVLSILGQPETEVWETNAQLQECVAAYEEATGETVVGPDELVPDPDGRTNQTWIALRDFCGELVMFRQIAEAAGPDLTVESWQAAVAGFGELTLPSTAFASICEGKYSANDAVQVVEFDPTVGETGNWAPVGEIVDVGGDRCD